MKLVSLICLSGFILFTGCRQKEAEKDTVRTVKTVVVKKSLEENNTPFSAFPCCHMVFPSSFPSLYQILNNLELFKDTMAPMSIHLSNASPTLKDSISVF